MDLKEINNQIDQLKIKLNEKVVRKTGGKGKIKMGRIPLHLRRYYEEEITKLERKKIEIIQIPKEIRTEVKWEMVKFENSQIRLIVNNHFTEPYPVVGCRESFEHLKQFIKRSNLKPLLVQLNLNKIVYVENLGDLESVIKILHIHNEINHYFYDYNPLIINKILSKLKEISKSGLIDFYSLNRRNEYFVYLCNLQSLNYGIIPTTETKFFNDKTISEEETFIFTIENTNSLLIVWESTLINKATYVFQTCQNSYNDDVQKLFNYVASNQNSKRRKLRLKGRAGQNPFNLLGIVDHYDLNSWSFKLNSIIKE